MKKIYIASIATAVTGTLAFSIFLYLSSIGAITVTGFSGDSYCSGTLYEPCYAIINFTANEDIFIYPTNYDPWGRNTSFFFDPDVKSWRLERSWGTGWRDIALNDTCKSTWCGAPNSLGDTSYSVAFRKGKNYSVRIVAYKNSPSDSIKWGAFKGDPDEVDPTWFGIVPVDYLKKYKISDETVKVGIDDNKFIKADPSETDAIFSKLNYIETKGKKFEFVMNVNSTKVKPKLIFAFNEICGHIVDYKLYKIELCEKNVSDFTYMNKEVCKDEINNITSIKEKVCINESVVDKEIKSKVLANCSTEVPKDYSWGMGENTPQVEITEFVDEMCYNGVVGTKGHLIDIIPMFEDFSSSKLIIQDKWAYYNTTGGNTIAYDGNYTVVTFTTNGTLVVDGTINATVLVVAGGGGGGGATADRGAGGGGGAGGLIYNASYTIISSNMTITIGQGGTGCSGGTCQATNGSNSIFGVLTAIGGGSGGSQSSATEGTIATSGGSGGGSSGATIGGVGTGGAGTTGQGYNGGNDSGSGYDNGAGGGGASTRGMNNGFEGAGGGSGGNGTAYSINGSSVYYAGAGGGGGFATNPFGVGGLGGGGNGSKNGGTGSAGTNGLGGGGGGGGASGAGVGVGGNGGSGIVIVRYLTYVAEALYPSVTLNSPANNTNYSTTTTYAVTFNFTVKDSDSTSLNTTFYLNGVLNVTNTSVANNSQVIISKTLPIGYYNWSVNVTDGVNSNVSGVYYFNITPIYYVNLSVAGFQRNITVELGSLVNLSANVTASGTVCIDFNHPDYGVNYSCDTNLTWFNANVTWFRTTTFNDSTTIKNLTYTSASNQTIYVSSHQYDEALNLSFNLTGYYSGGSYPSDVKIYLNNTLVDEISIALSSPNFTLTTFSDETSAKNSTFTTEATNLVGYINLPSEATLTSNFTFNITGYPYINGYCYQQIANESSSCGGISGGNFTTSGNVLDDANAYDKSYDTYAYPNTINNYGYLYSNMSINSSFSTSYAYWQIKVPLSPGGDAYFYNYTIPSGCLDNGDNILQLAVVMYRYPSINKWSGYYCKTSPTNWQLLFSFGCSILPCEYYKVYEINNIYWGIPSYSNGTYIKVGDLDGTYNWNTTTELNTTPQKVTINDDDINTYLSNCSDSCDVPIYSYTIKPGVLQFNNLNLSYNYSGENPIVIDLGNVSYYLNNSVNATNIPIKISSATNGTINVSDLRYDYRGGNKTYVVTAHDSGNTVSQNYSIIYYYSDWQYHLPTYTNYIEFIPRSGTSKNVTPYRQTPSTPIMNVTMTNYNKIAGNFSVLINQTINCTGGNITYYMNVNSTKPSISMNTNAYAYKVNQSYLSNFGLWMWADYTCNSTAYLVKSPKIRMYSCCVNCDVCVVV